MRPARMRAVMTSSLRPVKRKSTSCNGRVSVSDSPHYHGSTWKILILKSRCGGVLMKTRGSSSFPLSRSSKYILNRTSEQVEPHEKVLNKSWLREVDTHHRLL